MPGIPDTARDEVRKALALVRRLSRPAHGLLEMLEEIEVRLTCPSAIDRLIGPQELASALARLLTAGGSSDARARRARTISPEPPLRALSKPDAPKSASESKVRVPDEMTPSGTNPKTRKALAPDLPPDADAKPELELNRKADRKKDGQRGANNKHKPASLREIAEMRHAQKRKLEPKDPLPSPSVSKKASDLLHAAKTKDPGDTPAKKTFGKSTHALVTLAKKRARDGLTLPLQKPPQPAALAARLDAPFDAPHTPVSSPAQESRPQPASVPVNALEASPRTARQSVDPDVSPLPEVRRDGNPDWAGPWRPEPKKQKKLSNAAWRNGVEPQ